MMFKFEFSTDMKETGTRVAEREGVSVEALLAEAVEACLSEEEREHTLMLGRLAQARSGESLSRAEMDKRFEKMLRH